MSKVTEPILLDKTGRDMVDKMHTQNVLLGIIAGAAMEDVKSMDEVRKIVQSGKAAEVFNVGDQFKYPWKDVATGTTYDVVADIIGFKETTLKNGDTVPSMVLQWHYCTPFGVQFDAQEAFYCAEDDELPAGTYHIKVGANWGTYCKQDETYSFVLTKPVPKGGQLVGFYAMPDKAPAEWKVTSYASSTSTVAIETVAVTAGAKGTLLGSFVPAGDGKLNSLHRLAYGYNRWSHSALEQWLNSDAGVGNWWKPKNKFDRPPEQLATKAGFLTGFDKEFLDCVLKVKVTTALNTVTDAEDGTLEDTYDKFYVPALEEMNINPQLAGEGTAFDYWKKASESQSKLAQYGTYPQMRTFAIENHLSPQHVRLRSANRGNAYNVWFVNSSGHVNYITAVYALRCSPAYEIG